MKYKTIAINECKEDCYWSVHLEPVEGQFKATAHYSDDPARDADVYYVELQRHNERQAEEFCERVSDSMHDFETFQMFLNYIDLDAAEIKAFHGCLDEDQNTKVFAYDQFMNLYEEYVTSITEV